MNVEDLLTIDETRLDREWLAQPSNFYLLASEVAQAKKRLEEAKGALANKEAKLQVQVQSDPTAYGLDKATVAAVNTIVASLLTDSPEKTEFIDCKLEAELLSAGVTAMDHKKRALENLVHLHSQNYFSEPRAPAEDVKAVTQKAARTPRKRRRRPGKKKEE